MRKAGLITALVLSSLAVAGCDRATPENLDEWTGTQRGPGKLLKVVKDSGEQSSLRGHAASNLITIGRYGEVRDAMAEMEETERRAVADAMVDRLWDVAKSIPRADAVPKARQSASKDALFELRPHVSEAVRQKIDTRLVEWLTGGIYAGRAKTGRVNGRRILGSISAHKAGRELAGTRMVEVAQAIIARPQNADGSWPKMPNEVLFGLAASGDKAALELLLGIVAQQKPKDESLPKRAMNALYQTYVQPTAEQRPDPRLLVPVLPKIVALAKDEYVAGRFANDAFELIALAGKPECLVNLVEMVNYAHSNIVFRYRAIKYGLECGGAAAVSPLVEAIPVEPVERAVLDRYVWKYIKALPDRAEVEKQSLALLSSDNPVARVSGLELLAAVGKGKYAEQMRKLERDRAPLKGWRPKSEKRRDTTVGQIAKGLASQ